MEIRTDVEDFYDEVDDFEGQESNPTETQEEENNQPEEENEPQDPPKEEEPEDFISSLLKTRGIEDKTKIKFENEEGEIEEVDWESLSNEEKMSILESSNNIENELDEAEIELINAIRNSQMSPAEYLQYVQQTGVNNYIQNNSNSHQYLVDQYSDDELFIADFMSRMEDVTEEEAQEALERAKSNETLFAKQIGAIRNEYKKIEEENIQQEQIEQETKAQEQYQEFANSVIDQINNFTEFQGYDLNMEYDDMQELYEFITGKDAAGNNHFAKALSDPKILVQTAWFALNGKQMIQDITDYFQKEITQVRKESYKKGQEDAKNKGNKPDVVFTNKSKPNKSQVEHYSDLDDF